jgi:hypothetical protein
VRAGVLVVKSFVLSDLAQCAMTDEKVHALLRAWNSSPYKKFLENLRVRPGRTRDSGGSSSKPFVVCVLASAQKTGGISVGARGNSRSSFGRGEQQLSVQAGC